MTDQIEQMGDSRRPEAAQRRRRAPVRLLAGVLLAGAVSVLACLWPSQALEQRIAAVNASHTPAPEKNAAAIYDQMIPSYVLTGSPADFRLPPAAIAALIEASKMESCWFPLAPGEAGYREHSRRIRAVQEWARAIANGVGEDVTQGDMDAAAEKLRCIIRLGGHLRQQALLIDFGVGCGAELGAWFRLRDLIMQPDASAEILGLAAAMPAGLTNDSEQAFRLVQDVQPLISTSVLAQWTLRQRLENWWWRLRGRPDQDELLRDWYLRLLSVRRGVRVLAELRRYHDQTGRWPESLDAIRTLVPAQALIDPCTEQRLVYKRIEDGFLLYSKGPNRIDENGMRAANGPDDWRIWPR